MYDVPTAYRPDDDHLADDHDDAVTRLVPLVAVLALAASGCGGSANVASQTGGNVAKIHSGVLDLRLVVTPHGGGSPFGFELRGPFALREGKLPVARLALTQIANGKSATATLVSDGRRAWIVSNGDARALVGADPEPPPSLEGGSSGLGVSTSARGSATRKSIGRGPPTWNRSRVRARLDVGRRPRTG